MSVEPGGHTSVGMRTPGSPAELERRRRLAVRRLDDGYDVPTVADLLGVAERTVWRWAAAARDRGPAGLAARPVTGRPPRLNPAQRKAALRCLRERPTDWGFPTELWTAARVAQVLREVWAVDYHPRYLSAWLRAHGWTPQTPRRAPRERKPEVIDAWCAADWPRIQKTSGTAGPTCC